MMHEPMFEKWVQLAAADGTPTTYAVGTLHSTHYHAVATGLSEQEADRLVARLTAVAKGEKMPEPVHIRMDLNSTALDRLLGGDVEMEFNIRKQIVNDFMNRHIPQVMKDETIQATLNTLRTILQGEIVAQIGQVVRKPDGSYNYTYVPSIKPWIDEVIKKRAQEEVEKRLGEYLKDRVDYYARDWPKYIDKKVKEVFDAKIQELVSAGVEEAIKRMKAALG